ncbi:hypothetical protein LY76DRAFT_632817, partial [Colletotrichum caudatum]
MVKSCQAPNKTDRRPEPPGSTCRHQSSAETCKRCSHLLHGAIGAYTYRPRPIAWLEGGGTHGEERQRWMPGSGSSNRLSSIDVRDGGRRPTGNTLHLIHTAQHVTRIRPRHLCRALVHRRLHFRPSHRLCRARHAGQRCLVCHGRSGGPAEDASRRKNDDLGSLVLDPRGLRVPDTKRPEVLDAPAECRHVALSYVWGQGNGRGTRTAARRVPSRACPFPKQRTQVGWAQDGGRCPSRCVRGSERDDRGGARPSPPRVPAPGRPRRQPLELQGLDLSGTGPVQKAPRLHGQRGGGASSTARRRNAVWLSRTCRATTTKPPPPPPPPPGSCTTRRSGITPDGASTGGRTPWTRFPGCREPSPANTDDGIFGGPPDPAAVLRHALASGVSNRPTPDGMAELVLGPAGWTGTGQKLCRVDNPAYYAVLHQQRERERGVSGAGAGRAALLGARRTSRGCRPRPRSLVAGRHADRTGGMKSPAGRPSAWGHRQML